MPNLGDLPTWAVIILALLVLLIGGGGGGFIVAWRKDQRQEPIDTAGLEQKKVEITEAVQRIAKNAVSDAEAQMKAQDDRHRREIEDLIIRHTKETGELRDELVRRINTEKNVMLARIGVLEGIIRARSAEVPPWPEGEALRGA